MNLVARESPDPVGHEFRICFDEQNYGLELRAAIHAEPRVAIVGHHPPPVAQPIREALVDHVIQVGPNAFLDEQFATTPSDYPDALKKTGDLEPLQERFFQNALSGQDQLRQRVAFA